MGTKQVKSTSIALLQINNVCCRLKIVFLLKRKLCAWLYCISRLILK